jgi:hypothetical protein
MVLSSIRILLPQKGRVGRIMKLNVNGLEVEQFFFHDTVEACNSFYNTIVENI